MRETRSYGHFCMLARALERLGDRWTLLIVRDLLVGRRRFTDLMARLGGITPKTLSSRLRDLEAQGIVHADRETGRREVWYQLTPSGRELGPVVEELTLWGFRNARRPRAPGEPLHPEHLLQALRVVLGRSVPARPVRWCFRFTDDAAYSIECDGRRWSLIPSDTPDADVVVTASSDAWAQYLTTAPSDRPAKPTGISFDGTRRAVHSFQRDVARFPNGADPVR